jgi:penicillin amidase
MTKNTGMRRTAWGPASGATLAALLWLGGRGIGPLPPVGPLLDPARGVWALARSAELPPGAAATVPGLADSVTVLYDDRGVPHVFAADHLDAVRALGFITARDRLFQLEVQTRATAGTLTEWLGRDLLGADRQARQLGLAWSAEREWAAVPRDAEYRRIVEAYADGVNAWLDAMRPHELPLEYRLLGVAPSRWQPVHALYLLRSMSRTLTYDTWEFTRERIVSLVGERAADALFPIHAPIREPIVPTRERFPQFDGSPLPPPRDGNDGSDGRVRQGNAPAAAASGVGSNNWAVAPSRSASGHALLAGDPHLELTLPSVWYEAHLVVPDSLDMYGVTIPGSAAMVIGFTRDVAWSYTNTGADVVDYYLEELDDPGTPTRYRLDGSWRPLELRVETYRDRRGHVLAVDTIYHTHRGPVEWRDGRPYSMRWTAHDGASTGAALSAATHAHSVAEFLDATEGFAVPAQNMIAADRQGSIAIRSTGRFPIRPGDGRGDRILDGTESASDWTGWWPVEDLPASVNPAQGFLASANQEPETAGAQSRYLGANWPSPWRAMRINTLLRGDASVTPEDLRAFQTDPGSARADVLVPAFLDAVDRAARRGVADSSVRRAARLLASWDRRYTRDNTGAVLFELAMTLLPGRVWDELAPSDSAGGHGAPRVATPSEATLWLVGRSRDPVRGGGPRCHPGRDARCRAGQRRSTLRRSRGRRLALGAPPPREYLPPHGVQEPLRPGPLGSGWTGHSQSILGVGGVRRELAHGGGVG